MRSVVATLALVAAACDPPVRELRVDELWVTLPATVARDPSIIRDVASLTDPGIGAIAGTDGRCSARVGRWRLEPTFEEPCTARASRLVADFEKQLGVDEPGSLWTRDIADDGRMTYISRITKDRERVIRIQRGDDAGEACLSPVEVGFVAFDCSDRNMLRMHACNALRKVRVAALPAFCGR